MKYLEFREKVKDYPFVPSNSFGHITQDLASFRNQVSSWVKKGLLIQLKRGLYTLREEDRRVKFSKYFLANNLYSPSYISLETALSYYGLSTERAFQFTSISTKKTQCFENYYGKFTYRSIKAELYDHFIAREDEFGNTFYIASPEKALCDFFYFKIREIESLDKSIFEDAYRLQNLDLLKVSRLKQIAEAYPGRKFKNLMELLIEYIKEEWY